MGANDEKALKIVRILVEGLRGPGGGSGRMFWTCSDLASALGSPGQQRLLGDPLDRVRTLCERHGLPDLATVVIDRESLLDGTLRPSPKAIEKYGGWPGLREAQAQVMTFDWSEAKLPG